jgi:hypothetical protein
MNLQETVRALEAKNIQVAIDVGVHSGCALDSNCPKAVELRRYIAGAGVTLEQLLEGYEVISAPDPVRLDDITPDIEGRTSIVIAGQQVQLDLTNLINEQVRQAWGRRVANLQDMEGRIRRTGRGLYDAYLDEIRRSRNKHTLPQLSYSTRALIEAGCLITSGERHYIFLFPDIYNPQYLIKDGFRYKMSDEHIIQLQRPVYLKFSLTPVERKFYVLPTLLTPDWEKFRHYHGRTSDCWGQVTIPERWDGTLTSLKRLNDLLMKSLITINLNSLVERQPPDMPHAHDTLLVRSTVLGREGELEHPAPAQAEQPRQGWGAGWRARERTETRDNVMIRRFGTLAPTMEIVCAECGQPYAEHRGVACP